MVARAVAPLGGTVGQVFTKAINGAVVTLPVPAVADLLGAARRRRRVAQRHDAHHPGEPAVGPRPHRPAEPAAEQQLHASPPQGSGVTAYVIDTGIRTTHVDFGGQATSGFDAIDGGPADDCNGHGTHVSGTVGGTTYGVAKDVSLVAVRVLNCEGSGTNAQVISGIEWAIGNHAAGQPAVANMSLGGAANTAIDTAIRNLHNDGVTVVVAAGNETADACSVVAGPGRRRRSPSRPATSTTPWRRSPTAAPASTCSRPA